MRLQIVTCNQVFQCDMALHKVHKVHDYEYWKEVLIKSLAERRQC
jgi:hypothetical protein